MDVGEHDPEHPAEQYALGQLREGRLEPEQLEILAYLLPGTSSIPKRFGVVEDAQKVWSSGAFVHGGVLGLKRSTTAFPMATRAFVKYAKQVMPEHEFNSVAINVNVQAKGHKDIHNAGKNLVIPLSAFKGGEIELDTPDGTQLLTLQDGPKMFDPKCLHSTRQWSNGNRVVVLAYSARDSEKLKAEDSALLRDIGFHWTPHRSRPLVSEESAASLRAMRVGLIRPSSGAADGVEADVEPDSSAERTEGDVVHEAGPEPLLHVRQDLDVVLQDLEERAARLRDLLEEEEMLSEEYRRVGDEARGHLRDARDSRDQASQYLEEVRARFSHVESLRAMTFLRAMSASSMDSSANS